jgi:hypothetical protein
VIAAAGTSSSYARRFNDEKSRISFFIAKKSTNFPLSAPTDGLNPDALDHDYAPICRSTDFFEDEEIIKNWRMTLVCDLFRESYLKKMTIYLTNPVG